jgi:uncharacterized protein YjbI with pentapeptide repeats
LTPGADVDHRGTEIDEGLLARLLRSLRDPSGTPRFGEAKFSRAVFLGAANFESTRFDGGAQFTHAIFEGATSFKGAAFGKPVEFSYAEFRGSADYRSVIFRDRPDFFSTRFHARADFKKTEFGNSAHFQAAEFEKEALFNGSRFLGRSHFSQVRFGSRAEFNRVEFSRTADFSRSHFQGYAEFLSVSFSSVVRFDAATFDGEASFQGATFGRDAHFPRVSFKQISFSGASFGADVMFNCSGFDGKAYFSNADFSGGVNLSLATFGQDARFSSATFETAQRLGPFSCEGVVVLADAVFKSPVIMEFSAVGVAAQRVSWASTASLRLRFAAVDLRDAVFEYPVTISSHLEPFTSGGDVVDDTRLPGSPKAKLTSLQGVNASHLLLSDINLAECQFAGTVNLDQLRMAGDCRFAVAPAGFHRDGWKVVRWTPRRTLVEEHHLRASRLRHADGWSGDASSQVLKPASLAVIYRQLRKSLEDAKNEPDAADFYYGEMEMRRNDDSRPRAERWLLLAYWALSGYGLRALRALGWLLTSMVATLLVMIVWGLPAEDAKATYSGSLRGDEIRIEAIDPAPRNPDGTIAERFSSSRFEKSLRVVINSVIFRSSQQSLTTVGTYTEMTSRLVEPLFLGLAVLAVRGRVKR